MYTQSSFLIVHDDDDDDWLLRLNGVHSVCSVPCDYGANAMMIRHILQCLV